MWEARNVFARVWSYCEKQMMSVLYVVIMLSVTISNDMIVLEFQLTKAGMYVFQFYMSLEMTSGVMKKHLRDGYQFTRLRRFSYQSFPC